MKYIVDRNKLDTVIEVDVHYESAMSINGTNGVKYTKFGPIVFVFDTEAQAEKLIDDLLNEQIVELDKKLASVKHKKTKFKDRKARKDHKKD